jgi:hypothetical protein
VYFVLFVVYKNLGIMATFYDTINIIGKLILYMKGLQITRQIIQMGGLRENSGF